MYGEPCEPVDGVEGLFGLSVLRTINDFGGAVGRFVGGDVAHALLGETGSDDVFGEVAEGGFVFGPNSWADMDAKSRVSPGKHVFYYGVVDFSLFFQHLQDFVLKGLFEVFGVETRNADKRVVREKAAVGGDGVQVRIWIEKIAVRLYGDARSGDCAFKWYRGFQKGAHDIPRALAQFAEQGAVVYKIDPEAFGYAENPVSAGDFFQNLCQKPFAVFDDPLLVARGAKMAAFARKRQKIFVAAIVASNPGEAASQVAAFQIPLDHVLYIRSPESVSGSVQSEYHKRSSETPARFRAYYHRHNLEYRSRMRPCSGRHMWKRMLEKLGYRVTARTCSLEALRDFSSAPGDYDVIITDQTMPNMTVEELAEEAMKLRQDIPVILCTGFSEKVDADKAAKKGIRALLFKPILKYKMATTIRDVLRNDAKRQTKSVG